MKPSTLLFTAATAQAGLIRWPQQHAPAPMPCGHHGQIGHVQNTVHRAGPARLGIPFITRIRIFWPLSTTRPSPPSPAEIIHNVFDKVSLEDYHAHDTEEPAPPYTAPAEPELKDHGVTVLAHPDAVHDERPAQAEADKHPADAAEAAEKAGEEEAAADFHEDLKMLKRQPHLPDLAH